MSDPGTCKHPLKRFVFISADNAFKCGVCGCIFDPCFMVDIIHEQDIEPTPAFTSTITTNPAPVPSNYERWKTDIVMQLFDNKDCKTVAQAVTDAKAIIAYATKETYTEVPYGKEES